MEDNEEVKEIVNITIDDGKQKVVIKIEDDKLNLLFDPPVEKNGNTTNAVFYASIIIESLTK